MCLQCPKNLSLGVKSLKKVVPYLLSQTKNSMVWDALDASIFEQLKVDFKVFLGHIKHAYLYALL